MSSGGDAAAGPGRALRVPRPAAAPCWRKRRGRPFVWYNMGFNSELVWALEESFPITIELLGVINNLLGDALHTQALIDLAQARGIPTDACSADKLAIGAVHAELYPAPACTVAINTPCDAQVLAAQAMAEITGAPTFVINVPYTYGEETTRYVASQLAELIPFLEQHTGQTISLERLRRVCELSNQATEAVWDWLEWRKVAPLEPSSKLVAFNLVIHILFDGTETGVALARSLAREARERSERGERHVDEKVRAVWYQDPVWTDLQVYDWLERDLGLTVPIDIFGYYANEGLIDTTSRESMLYGLARRLANCQPMARQFRGDMAMYVRDFLHLHEAWNADCAIFAGHIACKHAWGGIGLFREACRAADIPLLVFEFDMFDPRVTSYDDVFFELQRFVEEIAIPHRRRRRGRARAGRP